MCTQFVNFKFLEFAILQDCREKDMAIFETGYKNITENKRISWQGINSEVKIDIIASWQVWNSTAL